jgi:type I restriction-modification system DNA methylase subunit
MSLSSFIWSVADLLRGDYKQSEYGKVILPFTVLRRLDCVLAPTKAAVLAEREARKNAGINHLALEQTSEWSTPTGLILPPEQYTKLKVSLQGRR